MQTADANTKMSWRLAQQAPQTPKSDCQR